MLSDQEIISRLKSWKKVTASLIARRFKITEDRARGIFSTFEKGEDDAEIVVKNKGSKRYRMLFSVFGVLIALNLLFVPSVLFIMLVGVFEDGEGVVESFYDQGFSCGAGSNIALIPIEGDILTYSYNSEENGYESYSSYPETISSEVVEYIQEAEKSSDIEAIVLSIDSYGGMPVAAEEIASAIQRAKKPTVAVIRGQGLSAAYWVASAADTIFASAISEVGSIGVTSSYLDRTKQNESQGLSFVDLSSAPFKDTGNPDKNITEEERELIQKDVNKMHEVFVQSVSDYRNLPKEKVALLADGASLLGEEAARVGLVDYLGDLSDAYLFLEEKIGDKAEVCRMNGTYYY